MSGGNEGILGEVKDFLENLTLELPLVFPAAAKTLGVLPRSARRVPYRGQDVSLVVEEAPDCDISQIFHDSGGLRLRRGRDRQKPQEVLREWLVDRARETFVERAAFWAGRLGVRYARIAIRDQRTVWGSATKEGHLSFNWRLIMAPPEVLDYLVIHELAHLREMNHSKGFWALVARQSPRWREHRRWLRDHSRRLKGAVRRAC